jgi:SP family myo-inositol transporter-like MFS transporter 13
MPWTINAELYPQSVRSLAIGIATCVNWGGNLLVASTFLSVIQAFHAYGAFWIYSAIGALGSYYLYVSLPETNGLRLEEIQHLFNRGNTVGQQRNPVYSRLQFSESDV